jgi:hypothetical protein
MFWLHPLRRDEGTLMGQGRALWLWVLQAAVVGGEIAIRDRHTWIWT